MHYQRIRGIRQITGDLKGATKMAERTILFLIWKKHRWHNIAQTLGCMQSCGYGISYHGGSHNFKSARFIWTIMKLFQPGETEFIVAPPNRKWVLWLCGFSIKRADSLPDNIGMTVFKVEK